LGIEITPTKIENLSHPSSEILIPNVAQIKPTSNAKEQFQKFVKEYIRDVGEFPDNSPHSVRASEVFWKHFKYHNEPVEWKLKVLGVTRTTAVCSLENDSVYVVHIDAVDKLKQNMKIHPSEEIKVKGMFYKCQGKANDGVHIVPTTIDELANLPH
jgi:hypothetical protein